MPELATLQAQVAAAGSVDFWTWTLLCAAVAVVSVKFLHNALVHARIIEDTPTARIRSAPQGYVELIGTGQCLDGPVITAPLSGKQCIWFSYDVERKERYHANGRARTRWRTVESETSEALFKIVDDTGEAIIDPDGAGVTPNHVDRWYGSTARPQLSMGRSRSLFSGATYRYTEKRLHPGEPLYAIGQFRSVRANDQSDLNQDIAAILRAWKKQPQQHLLPAFDVDRDGHIDIQEWEQARAAARAQALEGRAQEALAPATHVLGNTSDKRRPFLLSATPQTELARKYRLVSVTSSLTFLGGGLVTVWLLLTRLSA